MPYIEPKSDRQHIEDELTILDIPELAGILRTVPSGKVKGAFNYFVSRLWLNTFFPNGKLGYTPLSDAIRVFNDMEHEMERRLMDKYEDKAIEKNGDLPEFEKILGKKK